MAQSKAGQRADRSRVTGIKHKREDGSAKLFKGVYGPQTMMKEVEHSTTHCPECGAIGRYDERGDIVCDGSCGIVISAQPDMFVRRGVKEFRL